MMNQQSNQPSNNSLQNVMFQYVEENMNLRIVIEQQAEEIVRLREELENERESGDK